MWRGAPSLSTCPSPSPPSSCVLFPCGAGPSVKLCRNSFLHFEVHFFFVNPSREYWGDLISTKEANKKKVFHRGSGFDPSNEYFETGNPLLSSMGSQSKTFLNRLLDIHSYEKSQYSDPGESNLLSIIHSDILNLRNPDIKDGRRHILSTDMSLKIHSCHSPMREIEVLQDNLLDLFETMPDLQPQEVLVMAPDIELYAPFISAVFGGETQKKKQKPFQKNYLT